MYVLCVGLKHVWQDTLGALLHAIGDVGFGGVFGHGSVHPLRFVSHASDDIENKLGDLASGYEHAMGFWFHQTARLQGWIADETWKISRDLYHFGGWVVHTYVPAYVHGVTDIIHTVTSTTTKVVHVTETKVVHLTRTVVVTAKNEAAHAIPNVTIPYVGEWRWLHKHWRSLTHALAIAAALPLAPVLGLERVWRGIDDLRKWKATVGRRLRKLEALFGVAAFAAAMANVLGLPNWRCLTRGNIGKTARRLCGLSPQALEDILGLLVDVVLVTDICQVVGMLESGLEIIQGPIDDIVGVVGGSLCHGDYDAPPDVGPFVLSLPTASGYALNPA